MEVAGTGGGREVIKVDNRCRASYGADLRDSCGGKWSRIGVRDGSPGRECLSLGISPKRCGLQGQRS